MTAITHKKCHASKVAVLLGLSVLTVSGTQAKSVATPPHTLDLNTAPSPVLNAGQQILSPQMYQTVQPSMQSTLNEAVQDYRGQQLTPQQVADIKVANALTNKLTQSPYLKTPLPVIRTLAVNLAPDSIPPVMRISQGMLSTLVFTDTDGKPWEIEQVQADSRLFRIHGLQGGGIGARQQGSTSGGDGNVGGNPKFQDQSQINMMEMERDENGNLRNKPVDHSAMLGTSGANVGGSFGGGNGNSASTRALNMVMIEPLQAWSHSNIVVMLKGKSTPVIILVSAGQDEVDIRLDMRVAGQNPDTPFNPYRPQGLSHLTDIDNQAIGFLDGRIPDVAQRMIASDPSVQGWLVGSSLYVKTSFDVLHPAYSAKVSTADGLHSYRFDNLQENRTISFLQRQGQPVTVTFEHTPYYSQ